MAVDLGMGIDTSVTMSLHPQCVGSLIEYDEDTSGYLQQVVDAFQTAYEGVGKVHRAREAAQADPTMTEAAQVLRTADAAAKVFDDATSRFSRVTSNMQAGILLLEKELTTPLETRTAHPLSVEVRAFIRELKAKGESPMDFVRNAIQNGESEVVSAALGAPYFLSDLTPQMQTALLRIHHERSNPVGAKRLRAMKSALELLNSNSGLLNAELEKAVGVKPHEVAKLRQAKQRTDRAFAS